MFRERARIIHGFLRSLDVLALLASFGTAYWVRDRVFGETYLHHPGLYPIERYWPLFVVSVAGWLIGARFTRVYEVRHLPSIEREVRRIGTNLLVVGALVGTVGFATQRVDVSRLFIVFQFAVSLALLTLNRLALRAGLRLLRRLGYSVRVLAVVGTGDLARRVAESVAAGRQWGYHFAGYIEADEPGPRSVGPVLGSVAKLDQMLGKNVLDDIIFAVPSEHLEDLESAALLCRKHGVTARICLDLPMSGVADLSLERLNGIPMLGLY
jgi:FlaA1/EpsC-like NDP-sugar epimerase